MSHPEPDVLALAALDEPVDATTSAHVQHCPQCGAELAELRRVVRGARLDDAPVELQPPPADVWGRIATEVGVTGTPNPAATAPPLSDADLSARHASGHHAGVAVPEAKRGRRRRGVILAAAAGVVFGATTGSLVASWLGSGEDDLSSLTTVATARLDPLSPAAEPGRAQILRQDGTRVLNLTLPAGNADVDAYREVWLLDAQDGRLVSLGVLEGSRGRFTLPRDLELADYPSVDVSAEPFDGDPAHSGDSLVRGDLTF